MFREIIGWLHGFFRSAHLWKFAAVGVVTTLLDILLFSTLNGLAGFKVMIANILSYGTCVILSFVLNRNWTFAGSRATGNMRNEAMRFFASNATGLLLSTLIVTGLAQFLPGVLAKIISVPAVFLWNYAAARHWVFRKS